MIYEKAVIRYEAVCDRCERYLGEFSTRADAHEAMRDHGRRFHD